MNVGIRASCRQVADPFVDVFDQPLHPQPPHIGVRLEKEAQPAKRHPYQIPALTKTWESGDWDRSAFLCAGKCGRRSKGGEYVENPTNLQEISSAYLRLGRIKFPTTPPNLAGLTPK